ncbi:MAG TPA: TetR/AcrR family transcriptional regulator [Spirochaetota bacterium]|nr:TetR/AcrR family transcriptional regulator [Spirochaetota bacterium]
MTTKSMNTRNLIITTALKLFNEEGAYRVTTNHIADKAGISPGNLYYYFRNKEEIIREIFQQILERFDRLWEGNSASMNAGNLADIFDETCTIYYEYRFFYLEITQLLGQDPELKKIYEKNRERRFLQESAMFHTLIDAGILMEPDSEHELSQLITMGWIISDFWLSYLFTSGRPITRDAVREYMLHVFLLLKPYLEPAALEMFQERSL